MTLSEVLRSALRRWYVVLFVVIVGACGALWLQKDGGTYATRTSVVFTLPGQGALLPENGVTDERVIAFAAVVAQALNNGEPAAAYATADAPSYGAGVRQGVWVGLPNLGGQWVQSYGLAQVELQIVGRTESFVKQKQSELLKRVTDIATTTQEQSDVPADARIRTSVVPLTTQINHIEPSRSAELLGFGAIGAASITVGTWLAIQLDRRVLLRRSRRATPVAWSGTPRG
jgi:hypothetical protein